MTHSLTGRRPRSLARTAWMPKFVAASPALSVLGGAMLALALGVSPAHATAFSYTGAVQSFTANADGDYAILAYGAQGGTGHTGLGGAGAEIGGTFFLTSGETLSLVVGGVGTSNGQTGGGGGGSFVYVVNGVTRTLLLAAGAGGGADGSTAGGAGLTTTSGGSFFNNTGGTNGSGGAAGGAGTGGGGAGWLSSGGCCGSGGAGGGQTYPSWAGGLDGHAAGANGGFGGGGGGSNSGAGGGGGYSGGGSNNVGLPGGGGGSYLGVLATDTIASAGVNTGNGSITITEVVPEPGSVALLAVGIIGLGGITVTRRRDRRPA